jgi:glycosyltransferase involved in cell wall biosynthesis
MRIGIDGHVLGKNIGGVERYVDKVVELVPDLSPHHQFVVFVTRQSKTRFAADPRRNVQFVSLPASDPIVQRSLLLPWAVRRHRLDILMVQRIAPWACGRCSILLAIHDLIPIKYANEYPGLRNWLIRLLTSGSLARADLIVCPSQSVCNDIDLFYPGTSAPRRAFYNGVDPIRFGRRDMRTDRETLWRRGVSGPFLFSPGAIEPRKNIVTILKALARLDPVTRPLLVLSGSIRDADSFGRMRQLAQELGIADRVRHVGFVSDEELVDLYSHATACIAASIDEGFSLSPLEAMACGTPVLCSDIPVHRELFEGAVTFFPPQSPGLLAEGIRDILATGGDRRAILDSANACIARLSWEAMARRMAMFFDELIPTEATVEASPAIG